MTYDDLLDHAVGKCVPIDTGTWGECGTHNVGWAPAAFKTRRCWAVATQVKAVDSVLDDLHSQVQVLYDEATWAQQADAYYKVLELLERNKK